MKFVVKHLLVITLVAFSTAAIADASALAFGSDTKYWGWATKSTQKEANESALKFCNESNPKKDCSLSYSLALVATEGGGKMGYGQSKLSIEDARKNAIEACGKPACKVTFEMTQPGFYSLARPVTNKNVKGYLQYKSNDPEQASSEAIEMCQKRSGQVCKIFWSNVIPGEHTDSNQLLIPLNVSEANCRPKTSNLTCTYECSNGDCLITYTNGCQIRGKVKMQFDSINNKWFYPRPSCQISD